jgi:hypothetical protein
LSAALVDGTADALCSDHTPVDDDAKQLPFGEAETGATGVELLLPLTLKWMQGCKLSLATALARITSQPARVLGINAGTIVHAGSADICVFDPERYWKIEPSALKSQGKKHSVHRNGAQRQSTIHAGRRPDRLRSELVSRRRLVLKIGPRRPSNTMPTIRVSYESIARLVRIGPGSKRLSRGT